MDSIIIGTLEKSCSYGIIINMNTR